MKKKILLAENQLQYYFFTVILLYCFTLYAHKANQCHIAGVLDVVAILRRGFKF